MDRDTLVERLRDLTVREISDGTYCRETPVLFNPDGPEAADRIEELEEALLQATAVLASLTLPQETRCHHEPYQGRCIHCDVPFHNGAPKSPKPPAGERG